MTPFAARISYLYNDRPDWPGDLREEACIVVGTVQGEERISFVCVTSGGKVFVVPPERLVAVVPPQWKAMMAEVELSATGEKKHAGL